MGFFMTPPWGPGGVDFLWIPGFHVPPGFIVPWESPSPGFIVPRVAPGATGTPPYGLALLALAAVDDTYAIPYNPFMKTFTATEARANLYRLLEETADSSEPIQITGRKG